MAVDALSLELLVDALLESLELATKVLEEKNYKIHQRCYGVETTFTVFIRHGQISAHDECRL